jgi:LasA protease
MLLEGFYSVLNRHRGLVPGHFPKSYRLIILGLVLVMASISCSLGATQPTGPFFTPPSSNGMEPTSPPDPVQFQNATPTPGRIEDPPAEAVATATPEGTETSRPPILYYAQAGDILPAVAVRFGVNPDEIISPDVVPQTALLNPNLLLIIPNRLANTTSPEKILPDSELVYSPSAVDFDVDAFVDQAGGYLSTYKEWLGATNWTTGAEIVQRVAIENSINPRLLLGLLEYQSGWVYGQPTNLATTDYPMGKIETNRKGLYQQLAWAVNHLSIGYYGWREGLLTDIEFSDNVTARLAPDLNAGTVALQYYLAQLYNTEGWVQALSTSEGFPALYERMFGNPWIRSLEVEPLYPPNLEQPSLALPFFFGQLWSYTGGPHGAWEHDGARAALDFAPAGDRSGCYQSIAWVLASAPGLVVRSENGTVIIDLDGDGQEQTGWALLYLHIAKEDRLQTGNWVEAGDLLGHPSCEGGLSTGVHVHMARKYNGEWIPADGPMPFVLSGWTAHAGAGSYQGTLTRDGETVTSSTVGSYESRIIRTREEP